VYSIQEGGKRDEDEGCREEDVKWMRKKEKKKDRTARGLSITLVLNERFLTRSRELK